MRVVFRSSVQQEFTKHTELNTDDGRARARAASRWLVVWLLDWLFDDDDERASVIEWTMYINTSITLICSMHVCVRVVLLLRCLIVNLFKNQWDNCVQKQRERERTTPQWWWWRSGKSHTVGWKTTEMMIMMTFRWICVRASYVALLSWYSRQICHTLHSTHSLLIEWVRARAWTLSFDSVWKRVLGLFHIYTHTKVIGFFVTTSDIIGDDG